MNSRHVDIKEIGQIEIEISNLHGIRIRRRFPHLNTIIGDSCRIRSDFISPSKKHLL